MTADLILERLTQGIAVIRASRNASGFITIHERRGLIWSHTQYTGRIWDSIRLAAERLATERRFV